MTDKHPKRPRDLSSGMQMDLAHRPGLADARAYAIALPTSRQQRIAWQHARGC